jgi:hypothetical protein
MRPYRYLHVPFIKNGGGTGTEHYKIESQTEALQPHGAGPYSGVDNNCLLMPP